MNQNNGDICHSFIAALFYGTAIVGIIEVGGTKASCLKCLCAIFVPFHKLAHAQIVLVVFEQLLQTRSCHVGELYLSFH